MSSNEMSKAKILLTALGAVLFVALAFLFTNYRAQQPEDIIQLSPAEMSERVNELLRNFGFRDRPAERWSEYTYERAGDHKRVVRFVERQSLDHFQAVIDGMTIEPASGLAPGERRIVLDSKGRLVELSVKFPKTYDSSEPASKFDWNAAFTAAGLDIAAFTPVDTAWTPNAAADNYSAWTGKSPDDPSILLRVEASTFRGLLTNFLIVFPWNEPEQTRPAAPTTKDRLLISFSLVALAAFLFLAIRRVWSRTLEPASDVRPAFLLALFVFVPLLIGLIATTPQVAAFAPLLERATLATTVALAAAMVVWLVYVLVSSLIPASYAGLLASWQRISNRSWSSQSVGNDLLIGVLAGSLITVIVASRTSIFGIGDPISGLVLSPFGTTLYDIGWSIFLAAMVFGIFSVLLLAVRRRLFAGVLLFVLISAFGWMLNEGHDLDYVLIGSLAAILSIVAARYGLMAIAVAWVVAKVAFNALVVLVITTSPTIVLVLACVIVLVLILVGIMLSLKGTTGTLTDSDQRFAV